MPFVLLFLSGVFSVCSYFEFYAFWFGYLGDLVGYSILTNLFMYSVYFNKKYCDATKVAVLGLSVLNLCNLYSLCIDRFSPIYEIYIIAITILLSVLIKKKKL